MLSTLDIEPCKVCRHVKEMNGECPYCSTIQPPPRTKKSLATEFQSYFNCVDYEIIEYIIDGYSPTYVKAHLGNGSFRRACQIQREWRYFVECNK